MACHDVQGLLEKRLVKVEQQLAHLQDVKGTLKQWITECHDREASGSCAFIGSLDKKAHVEPKKENLNNCPDCS